MRSLLTISAFAFLALFATPGTAGAACDPHSGATCLGATCNTSAADMVGVTTMDGDYKNIIACLQNDAGEFKWKPMSASEGQQGSYCGLIRCFFSCSSNTTDISCSGAGVAEHIPCNGQSLIAAGTCSIGTATGGELGTNGWDQPYTTPVNCPSGYAREVVKMLRDPMPSPFSGPSNYVYVCVKT